MAPVRVFPLSSYFLSLDNKTVSHPGISLVGSGNTANQRAPAAGAPGRHGQHLTPSAASVGGGGTRNRPTPRKFCRGYVDLVMSDGLGGRSPLVGAKVRERTPRLPVVPRRRSGIRAQDGLTCPPHDQPGRGGARSSFLLLLPNKTLCYQMTPDGVQGRDSLVGSPPDR